ncbi:LCP family protein [Candidatus Roizmanbacteria bacterium]|nr:LCP family protein [Candidatus Roizmanbacteria bacterium]
MFGSFKTKIIIFLIVSFILLFFLLKPHYLFLTKTLRISPLKTLFSLGSLRSYDDQVAILILGISGGNHEGPNLSDSIIVINYDLRSHKLITISLPRDIWSDTLKDKINTAYSYGEAKQTHGGLKLAKAEIEAVVGMPIHYAAVIDFDKFKELIDFIDGIDVNIERSFEDKRFPIQGRENDECGGDLEYLCRYETVSFTKGKIHMDGVTALKFVRSRNATGEEGSDFARNKRQQKILEAIKNKLFSKVKTLDLSYLNSLYKVIDKLIIRDIENQQIALIARNILLSRNFSQKQINLSQNFFSVPDPTYYDGHYVLIPKDGNYNKIHHYISCLKQKGEKDNQACN